MDKIRPEDVSYEEWPGIIIHAVKSATLQFLRGFKPVRHLLKDSDFLGTRIKATVAPKLLNEAMQQGCVAQNAVFLDCGQLWSIPEPMDWPREPLQPGSFSGDFSRVVSSHLLLGRNERLYVLNITWEFNETWSEGPLPDKQWCEAHTVSIREVTIAWITSTNQYRPNRPVGMMILFALYRAQLETSSNLVGQYRHSLESVSKIEGYLRRLGVPVG
jgi:hypothetical protein